MGIIDNIKYSVKVLKSEDQSIKEKLDNLDKEYVDTYEKAKDCFIHSNISSKERGECMDETLDMLNVAQKEGISPQGITGSNVRLFSNELINARGKMDVIKRFCIEYVKFALSLVLCVFVDVLIEGIAKKSFGAIYNDILMTNILIPAFICSIVANVIREKYHKEYAIDSEEMATVNTSITVFQLLICTVAYIILDSELEIRSYATTFEAMVTVLIVSVIASLICLVIINIGGYEVIYSRYNDGIKTGKYELMMLGFASQYIKKHSKKNVSVKEYANEVIKDTQLAVKILPFVIGFLVLDIFALDYLILGLGGRWYLILAVLILAVAIGACIVLFATSGARKGMLNRIIEGQLDLNEYTNYVEGKMNQE